MAQGNGNDQRAARTAEHIGNVDKQVASPSDRAHDVWAVIKTHAPDLTDWDVICFSVEFLGMMVNVHPWLETPVKEVSKLVYSAHYFIPDTDVGSRINREPVNPVKGSDTSKEREADGDGVVRTRFTLGGGN
jgi:hypothetical protein